jgi:hypothetical protein
MKKIGRFGMKLTQTPIKAVRIFFKSDTKGHLISKKGVSL